MTERKPELPSLDALAKDLVQHVETEVEVLSAAHLRYLARLDARAATHPLAPPLPPSGSVFHERR